MHLMYRYLNLKILISPLWRYCNSKYFKITYKLAGKKRISATNSFLNEIIGTGGVQKIWIHLAAISLSTKVLQWNGHLSICINT